MLLRPFEVCGSAAGQGALVSLPAIAVSSIDRGIQGHTAPTLLLPTQDQPGSVTSPFTCSPRLSVLVVVSPP